MVQRQGRVRSVIAVRDEPKAPSWRSSVPSCRASRTTSRSSQVPESKLGGLAPIRVVNEVLAAGDGNRAVQTTAYNLPNDERVVREKGAKRVMLRNIQEAKFKLVLVPIPRIVQPPTRRTSRLMPSSPTR